jgi:mraW methylase family
MENILVKTASFALSVLEHYIRPGDCVVDATIGNGNDTLKLCQLVGETGKVYGFDIQEKALKNTASLLQKNGWNNAVLLHVSHAAISEFIKEKIQAAVFNLGYLPGGDHSVTTCTDETKKAILSCLKLLNKDGVLAIVFYPGHPAGAEEKSQLLPWASGLNAGCFHCVHTEMINQSQTAPSVLFITKKKEGSDVEA